MSGRLTVLFPALKAEHRSHIAAQADALGFACSFAENEDDARPLMADTEVFFGVSATLPAAAPGLKWVASPNAGAEPYCTPGVLPAGVILTNSAGAYGVTIAAHIVMASLEMLRRRADYLDIVARREWTRDLPIRSLHGARITLLGAGDIGCEAARRLQAFSPASITGLSRSGQSREPGLYDRLLPVSALDAVLPETDLLICSVPGTPETVGLLDARRLALLSAGAFLVNVGRGSLVDEEALCEALRAGRLGGAALDVFRAEPLPADSPLWAVPGLTVTPHISGNTTLPYTLDRVVALFLENLSRHAARLPLLRVVRPDLGY